MSSSAPCAPSNRMRRPALRASSSRRHTGARKGSTFGAISTSCAVSSSASHSATPEPAPQRIVMREQLLDLRFQRRWVGQIDHADRAPADLVLIGRADAALGRAELACPSSTSRGCGRARGERQDQRGVLGDDQIVRRDRDALRADLLDLLDQRPGIDDDAVADDRQLARPHDARRQAATACRSRRR